MNIAQTILSELRAEAKATNRILERVPMDKLSWKPHEKSSSLGKLAWHIASIPMIAVTMLDAGTFDPGRSARPQEMPESPDITGQFGKSMETVREKIGSLDDAALMEPFRMMHGEEVLLEMPKAGMLRTILLNHTYHHRGQLSVYLRLLDVPVPATYGTSADENPFM